MILGRVVGAVWGARRAAGLHGRKLLQVRPIRLDADARGDVTRAPLAGAIVVAADELEAGVGDVVLVAHGSRVRDLTLGPAAATKDVVVAIVDRADAVRAP